MLSKGHANLTLRGVSYVCPDPSQTTPQLKRTMRKQRVKRKLNHALEHLQEHIGKHAPLIITGGRIVLPKLSPDEEAATILARKMCELLEDLRARKTDCKSGLSSTQQTTHLTLASKVWNTTKTEYGIPTGSTRECKLEGCSGVRIAVRWPDGELTWPCSRGMSSVSEFEMRID